MARTVKEIKDAITALFISKSAVQEKYGLDPQKTFDEQFSKASIENQIFYNVASAINQSEQIFDVQTKEIQDYVDNMRPHTLMWYHNMIKNFQYGDTLANFTDKYDIIDESKQIIEYCSVKSARNILFIKVAKSENDEPAQLSTAEQEALKNYINRVKDAGVHYNLLSYAPDILSLTLLVYFDPLVMKADGTLIAEPGTSPVKDAVKNYIKNLPFDGVYSNMSLIDEIQKHKAVKTADVLLAQARYGANDNVTIDSIYTTESGYIKIDENNFNIEYRPYEY